MQVGITGVAIQPCSLMCLEVIFEGIDHQQLLTYCASDTEALWYLSSDVPAVEMLECQWSCSRSILAGCSVYWVCAESVISVAYQLSVQKWIESNTVLNQWKQAKKIANDMFSVLLSISFHVNVSIGEKTSSIHKIGRSLLCKASVRLAAFKRGWTIEYRFTQWIAYILVLCIQTMKKFMDMVCSDEVVFEDAVVLFGHWSVPSKLSPFVKIKLLVLKSDLTYVGL